MTLLSSMAYYDQIGQFDNASMALQTFFVVANVPVSVTGFVVVAVTVLAHLVLTSVVVCFFLRKTRFSRIGDTWSALGQAVFGDGKRYVAEAGLRSDTQIEAMMQKDGVRNARAGLRLVDGELTIAVDRAPVKDGR